MSFIIQCPNCKTQIGYGHTHPQPDGSQQLNIHLSYTEIPPAHAQDAPKPSEPQKKES